VLAFEESGAYRLLLSAMSEDPAELQRFYAETVEPLVAYDEQYETGLVQTVEAFLEADGNVAGTAQRLFTHRHTIRYRLERVKELSGLDVGSTDGREKLSLGLKAMRVLGIAHRGGPATEAGAGGGRVPRRT
jgi:DNA-binding PucR family transcriptional regulator